jgi:hypothetical protein
MAEDIPLILDDAMSGIAAMSGDVPIGLGDVDVDDVDLFGGPVELSLSSHPPPSKQLQARVNEQRIRGCNQCVFHPSIYEYCCSRVFGVRVSDILDESLCQSKEPLRPLAPTASPSSFAICKPVLRMRHGA